MRSNVPEGITGDYILEQLPANLEIALSTGEKSPLRSLAPVPGEQTAQACEERLIAEVDDFQQRFSLFAGSFYR
jgi:hypothetical protein